MRNIFSGLYWITLVSFILLVCILAILLGTPGGASFLIQKSTEFSGQRIYVSNLNGTILSGLNAGKIIFTNDSLDLELQEAEFIPSFSALLRKEFHIKKLAAGLISVNLPVQKEAPKEKPQAIELPEFSSPLKVIIDSLEIDTLTVQTGDNPMVYSDIKLSGSLHQSKLKINHLHSRFQTYNVDATGNLNFVQPFPLSIQADLADNNGSTLHAQVKGEVEHYQLIGAANVNNPSFPPLSIQLRSNGDPDHLDISQLTAQTLDSTLTITGKINWKNGLRIDTAFSAQDIDPGKIVAELPGSISLTGTASLIDQIVETQFKATGQLRGATLDLETELTLHDTIANIRLAQISLGKNVATLKGHVSPEQAKDIVYSIDASDLSTFYPGLGGKLAANGRLNGQWKKIEVESKMKGENLFFTTHHIKSLDLDIQPSSILGEYKLNFLANNIVSGEQSIESFSIHGEGNQKRQSLQISLQGGPYGTKLSANLSGQLNSKKRIWKGELNQLHASAADLPGYRQEQATKLVFSKKNQKISEFCLKGPTEKLCLDGDINLDKKSIIHADLKQLPLKRLAPWIPFSKSLTEHASSELKITGNNKHWQLKASGELDPNNRIETLLSFHQDKNTVSGNTIAQFDKLQWINLFTEVIDQPKGRLNANINFSGTATQPTFLGTIQLKEAKARVPITGTEITHTNILIELQPKQTAILSGTLKSGDGNITLKGETHWPEAPRWDTDIHLDGRNFLATDLPVARVNISPNINIKGNEKGIDVSGTLSIPNADIRIEDLPDSTIKASPDEEIIGESSIKLQQTANPSVLAVNTDVNIRLGTEIDLQGFGLDTGIEGALKLRGRQGKPINADGTLNMVDGKYSAYGKELTIEQGELYFNGPLDEPRMNLRVINPIDGIKVGLAITGSPRQPESHLFSTPPMSDTEALSYLLTGKPIGATGESESGMLVNAASKLGMKKSANRINEIRARAGFDTLQLEAGDDLTESELVIGKYLSARLYFEYVTQLFANSEVFSLRYEFSKKLHLEAESSAESQALDLIYQFEK